jgi:hypothetical protein
LKIVRARRRGNLSRERNRARPQRQAARERAAAAGREAATCARCRADPEPALDAAAPATRAAGARTARDAGGHLRCAGRLPRPDAAARPPPKGQRSLAIRAGDRRTRASGRGTIARERVPLHARPDAGARVPESRGRSTQLGVLQFTHKQGHRHIAKQIAGPTDFPTDSEPEPSRRHTKPPLGRLPVSDASDRLGNYAARSAYHRPKSRPSVLGVPAALRGVLSSGMGTVHRASATWGRLPSASSLAIPRRRRGALLHRKGWHRDLQLCP